MSYVIVKLTGGLGNQMFQYAAARQLAQVNQATLLLDTTGFETYKLHRYSLQHLDIQTELAPSWEVRRLLNQGAWWENLFHAAIGKAPRLPKNFRIIQQKNMDYDENFLTHRGDLYVDGYWQSPRYFQTIHNDIKQAFSILTPASQKNLEMAKQMSSSTSVSLHVRRADYFNNPKTLGIHGVCSATYYNRAVTLLRERFGADLTYYIFSDDIPWARENLQFSGTKVFMDFNDADRNYEDLRLMTLCRHHITANSTFSWWGAWLGRLEGVTITPAHWFEDESKGPKMDDLLPSEWIRLTDGDPL